MKNLLLPINLHTEICQLLPVWLAQVEEREIAFAASASLLAFSSCHEDSQRFTREIAALTPIGLNKWNLPCNPATALTQHRLLAPDQVKYLARILQQIGQNGLAQELTGCPEIEVTDHFIFGCGDERISIEHWTEEEALAIIQSAPWLSWKKVCWQGTACNYAVGSITRLPDEENDYNSSNYCDTTILDLQAVTAAMERGETITLPIHFLDMDAVLRIEAQLTEIGLHLDAGIIKVAEPALLSSDIPF